MNNKGIKKTDYLQLIVRILLLTIVVTVLWWLLFAEKENYLGLKVNDEINVTPEQIQSIKDIGQWEFLAISNEELVDTIRKGIFKDDQLVRIYYGTLRLGVDLSKVRPGWIQAKGDSVVMTLPKVGLLDNDFIDEARTKAFYESGKWTAQDREALYQKARRQMIAHALTPQNLKGAQSNAEAQFRHMLKAMGYNHINIIFEK
ncbi:MAG: DUF4230 domain-containing protein [Prevotella sp.]|nr:DUF4230 domain-containing protein [Prevotella sp.]